MALTQISTKGIKDGTITNADIGASAAIAGTKIDAAFGSQDLTVGGTASVPTDNLQLSFSAPEGHIKSKNSSGSPASNLAFHTTDTSGNTNRVMHLRYDGKVGIGTTSPSELFHINSATTLNGLLISSTNNSTRATMELNGKDSSGNQVELRLGGFGDTSRGEIFTVTNHSLGFATNNAATQMVLDTNGRLGIGTTSPVSKFDVTDGTTSISFNKTNNTPRIDFKGNNVSDLCQIKAAESNGGGILQLFTKPAGDNPVERLRIDSAGRLLYGLTSSGRETSLILQGNSNSYTTNPGVLELRVGQVPTSQAALGSIAFGCTGDKIGGTINAIADNADWSSGSSHPTALRFFTCPASSTSQFERMRIQGDGMIGIGTTGPKAGLHVASENATYGKSAVFGANGFIDNANYHYTDATITLLGQDADGNNKGAGIEFTARNTANSNWHHAAINMVRDGEFVFLNGGAGTSVGTEKMRLNTSGNLLIATTTSNLNSGSFGIGLFSDGSAAMFKNISGSGDVFRTGGTQGLLQVNGDGDAFNTNNSYGQISDETLKQDIVDAASQWDDIKNLKVRKFRFKDNPTGVLQIGVIAQETEKVSAGLVQEDDKGIKSVKYSVLYMKAVKCLQEAIAKIEVLETEVAALKAS